MNRYSWNPKKQFLIIFFPVVSHPQNMPFPLYSKDMLSKNKHTNIVQCDTEYTLLEELLKLFEKFDPDLLVGYDCAFQFDVLSHRINTLKIKNWSRVGKTKRSAFPYFKVGKIVKIIKIIFYSTLLFSSQSRIWGRFSAVDLFATSKIQPKS